MDCRRLDLALRHAGKEFNGLTFVDLVHIDTKNVNTKWEVKCRCGHVFKGWLNALKCKKQRCLKCSPPKPHSQNGNSQNEYRYLFDKWTYIRRTENHGFPTFESFLDFLRAVLGDKFSTKIRFKLRRKCRDAAYSPANTVIRLVMGLGKESLYSLPAIAETGDVVADSALSPSEQ